MNGTLVVLAPHPDDEVLGAGGTMARRAAEGAAVHVVVVTRGYPPLFPEEENGICREETARAHARLGVRATHFLDLPAAGLDTLPHREVNARLGAVLAELAPDEVLLPFSGDVHRDHRLVFESALVALRPHGRRSPAAIHAYETLSETNWNAPFVTPAFHPTRFVELTTEHLEAKLEALRCFVSQMRSPPHERSLEAARALALLRGAAVHVAAAEAFVTVRSVAHARP